jgi:hypothetical protein
MYEVLFIKDAGRSRPLVDVAKDVSLSLGLVSTQERDSSNYLEGRYFVGYASNAVVRFCHSEGDLPKFPYRVVLAGPILGRGIDNSVDTGPSRVAQVLSEIGFSVLVPSKGWARKDWSGEGVRYGRWCKLRSASTRSRQFARKWK